jgi:hypothetical protein
MKATMSPEQIRFLEEQVRFFDMGCDAAEQYFRPLDPESPDLPSALYRRFRSMDDLIMPMERELQKLPKQPLVRAAMDIVRGILGTEVDLRYGRRSQRAQREAGPAANPVMGDSADSAAETTGR